MIVKFTNGKKNQWDEFLDTCVYAYNTAQHKSIHYSPFLPVNLEFESRDGEQLLTEYQNSSSVNLCFYTLPIFLIVFQLHRTLFPHSLLPERNLWKLPRVTWSNIKVAQQSQSSSTTRSTAHLQSLVLYQSTERRIFLMRKRKGGGMDHK